MKPKTTTYPSKPSENSVEKAIIDFMQARGWRATRNHVGTFRTMYGGWVHVGAEHFPDWTFTRSISGAPYGTLQLMHVEVKKPGEKPAPGQHEMLASLNHLGELSVWASSPSVFEAVYAQYFAN